MPSTINATSTGSGGLISTGDASGQLELQANGSTKLTVSSSGVSFTGGIASPLEVTGNSTAGAEIRLPEDTDNGSNYVALKAANSIASNVTFTLPSADGTNGQVLQTNGSGTLSFATPSGGSWIFLSSVTANNSATVDIENTFDSTYDTYAIIVSGLTVSDTSSTRCRLKINGSYRTDAFYMYHLIRNAANETTYQYDRAVTPSFADSILVNGNGQRANSEASGDFEVRISNVSSTTLQKTINFNGRSINGASLIINWFNGAGQYSSGGGGGTGALTGIRFFQSTGNISSGTFRLYGIKNS